MSETIEPDAVDILEHAITLLEEWGWCRYNDMTYDGRMCMRGAVQAAGGFVEHFQTRNGNWNLRPARPWSTAFKADQARIHVGGHATFNDAEGRTKEEAIAKLREAAEYARTHS